MESLIQVTRGMISARLTEEIHKVDQTMGWMNFSLYILTAYRGQPKPTGGIDASKVLHKICGSASGRLTSIR